ncbi:hypothetical protein [Planktothrix paucivesiculata]|uniref:Uncharacterized protein n=1 Tax=Planktothrix paucivesiculata PCC 9631 TaxID=671071 RepID=A0A7Z9BR16_9CYAN|nr:hypothetical protein [Planktothrix paucivesiculata]VXD15384.1 conserved hypothetical protein [Planktothrix paucivesiculata PCC 9631]VXD15493.1 conserved hypothetical protein [Planktothrix paucivesiculata PCC 9631]VXD19833.1 conserved hypothetical protein [Planktothrix paucivesiculata PCC 9631]
MNTITFAGIKGKVIKSSPHGNYLTVELSDRITICGTKNNQFNWSEAPDSDSGFTSFIAYIGSTTEEQSILYDQIQFYGGHIQEFRDSKRNPSFPFEFKVKELSIDSLLNLFNELQS